MELYRYLVSLRMDRRTYAVCTVIYMVVYLLARRLFPPALVEMGLPPVWMLFVAAPRLRDIGWNPWISTASFVAGFISGFVGKLAGPGSVPILNVTVIVVSFGLMIGLAFVKPKAPDPAEAFT